VFCSTLEQGAVSVDRGFDDIAAQSEGEKGRERLPESKKIIKPQASEY
jgi:hypothetical protein